MSTVSDFTVGIVEDDPVTRDHLSTLVSAASGFRLVFSTGTVADTFAALEAHEPRVLLVDLRLPDGYGTEILARLQKAHRHTVALVISALGDEPSVIRAIRAGAMGYLLKDDNEQVVETSIRQLLNGGSPISPSIARHLIRHFRPPNGASGDGHGAQDRLSPRELDVLTFAAKGYSYQEVAELLGVSPNTVGSYTKRIYGKLAVNSRMEALFEAIRLGIVSPPTRE